MGAPGTPNEKQNGSNKDQNGAFFGVQISSLSAYEIQ